MANLAEVSQWENVIRQLENGEAATGGADGLANVQAKQLANRTKWLKENYLPLTGGALTGNALTWNGNDLTGSAIVAKSLANNGYIKYASGLIIQWGRRKYSELNFNDSTYLYSAPLNINFSNDYSFGIAINSSHSSEAVYNEATVAAVYCSKENINIKVDNTSKVISDKTVNWLAIGH